jgi:hypothetical protein
MVVIEVNWLSGYRKMVVTAVESIFGLLERGFDWGIWDVSFSHANLGITQIFLYFLAGLACARIYRFICIIR